MKIEETLKMIKEQVGLKLELCDYFAGIRNGNYFNVILKDRTCESKEYQKLENLVRAGSLKKVEYNGVNRVAIFFN